MEMCSQEDTLSIFRRAAISDLEDAQMQRPAHVVIHGQSVIDERAKTCCKAGRDMAAKSQTSPSLPLCLADIDSAAERFGIRNVRLANAK